jgi:hypothetical protein
MANRLLLEGQDDKHVLTNLLYNHNKLHDLFDFKSKDGIDTLLATLEEEIKATDADRLGIVIDADVDLQNQWTRVTNILIGCGFTDVPAIPDPSGTVVAGEDNRRVGIWLMPNNVLKGAVEDFVGMLIDHGDVLWPRAQTNVTAIPETDRRFRPTYLSKAQIHTWLAWQEEPGTRMGETFKKKYLDPAHPQAKVFVEWIRRLLA